MRTVSQLFKALSEETRIEILALLLKHEELCVCDVEQVLAVSQSKASRHLRYLLAAGLVQDRRDGLWMRYRIPAHVTADQRIILDAARKLLTATRVADLESRYSRWMRAKQGRSSARAQCA